jgi:uncharacterized protein (TIGR02757 family)
MRPLKSLKDTLDRFYSTFDFNRRLKHDPIKFPRRYTSPEDVETAGFIAACFAYGKVELFMPVIEKILRPAGKHPARFFRGFSLKRDAKYFRGIQYRFNQEEDVLCLVYILSRVLKRKGSLKALIYQYYRHEHEDIRPALEGFQDYLFGINTSPVYGKNIRPGGLTFFPNPRKGSACKRMNLFLRWMVRKKDIDLGIWDRIPPAKLIIPLDTHIAKVSKCLGLTKRSASDWKTAREITESLKRFDPADPIKYDFALCHHGISGLCKGQSIGNICINCTLYNCGYIFPK